MMKIKKDDKVWVDLSNKPLVGLVIDVDGGGKILVCIPGMDAVLVPKFLVHHSKNRCIDMMIHSLNALRERT